MNVKQFKNFLEKELKEGRITEDTEIRTGGHYGLSDATTNAYVDEELDNQVILY